MRNKGLPIDIRLRKNEGPSLDEPLHDEFRRDAAATSVTGVRVEGDDREVAGW